VSNVALSNQGNPRLTHVSVVIRNVKILQTEHDLSSNDDFSDLIRMAHAGDKEALGELLAQYRLQLRASAERRLGMLLARRVDASDIIQQTLLEAHESFRRFAGQEKAELHAWLRTLLHCNISNAIRDHLYARKRSLNIEQSLDAPAHDSAANGHIHAVARDATPSMQASDIEQSLRLLDKLDQLSQDQRAAVQMRYIECRSIGEIATELNRSRTAAAGLVKRGLCRLRRLMTEESQAEPGP
jgi:RNA polymerase sigma-70 factor (ECF subfamily)